MPIGRFLLAPLQLKKPSPETFRLAMEARGDREFIQMRKAETSQAAAGINESNIKQY